MSDSSSTWPSQYARIPVLVALSKAAILFVDYQSSLKIMSRSSVGRSKNLNPGLDIAAVVLDCCEMNTISVRELSSYMR